MIFLTDTDIRIPIPIYRYRYRYISVSIKSIGLSLNTALLLHCQKGTDYSAEEHVTCYCYMNAALCKLNKDDFERNIIMKRLLYRKG